MRSIASTKNKGAEMDLSVYVAGASAELDRCESFIAAVRRLGARVTYDWPAEIRRREAQGLRDADLTDEERKQVVERDCKAVLDSDITIALIPHGVKTSGMWGELGVARLAECQSYAVASAAVRAHSSAFVHLAKDGFFDDDEEALAMVERRLAFEDDFFIEPADQAIEALRTCEEAFTEMHKEMRARNVRRISRLDVEMAQSDVYNARMVLVKMRARILAESQPPGPRRVHAPIPEDALPSFDKLIGGAKG